MRLLTVLATLSLLTAAGCLGLGGGDDVTPAATDDEANASLPDDPLAEEPASSPATSPTPTSAPKPAANANNTNSSASVPPTPTTAAAAPRVETVAYNGSITGVGTGATSTPAGTLCCATAGETDAVGNFDVVATLAGIVVEVVWSDAQFDLDLLVGAPDYDTPVPPSGPELHTGHSWTTGGGQPGAPDAHATIVITDAEALALTGSWLWEVHAKGPANAVAFTTYVTLFYDATPPSDFTAVPPA